MKKKTTSLILCLSAILLCSCEKGKIDVSSSSSSSKEETTSSSSESLDSDVPSEGLYVSFTNDFSTVGKTFMEAFSPTVYFNGKKATFSSLSSFTLKKDNEIYSLYDLLLDEGNYKFTAKKGTYSFEKALTLTLGNPTEATEGNGYTQVSETNAKKYALQNVKYAGSLGEGKMPSTGDVKLLVIPLTFTDGPSFTNDELDAIEKGYFGEKEETGWESLASYYENSSYGKLHISGEVVSTYSCGYTEEAMQKEYIKDDSIVEEVVKNAVDYVFSNNSELEKERSSYDYDGDGYLDGIEIIYKANRQYSIGAGQGCSVWWNFTSSISSIKEDKQYPTPKRFFWSNIKQLRTGYYSTNIDTHTLVHETGHMLGLNDFYDYNGASYPTGGADMMELNIGDHSSYSKYLLGWVRPKVIDGTLDDFEININDFSSSGDCVILRNTATDPWNGTPYDEYLIMSYYTPKGLYEQDSKGYKEWASGYGTGGTYQYSGLQIFHIDERLYNRVGSTYVPGTGKLTNTTYQYTDDVLSSSFEIDSNNTLVKDCAFQTTSNTNAYSCSIENGKISSGSSFKEITIIPASGNGNLFKATSKNPKCSNLGSEDVLMGLSEFGCQYNGFSMDKMSDCFPSGTTFNDGSELEYNFFVSKQTEDKITVRFIKN